MKNFRLQPESSSPFLSILQPLHFSSCLDGSYLWIRYSIGFTFHLYPTVYFDHLLHKFLRTSLTLSNESKTILIIRVMSIFPSPFLLPLEIPSNFNESSGRRKRRNRNRFYLINDDEPCLSARPSNIPTIATSFFHAKLFFQPSPLVSRKSPSPSSPFHCLTSFSSSSKA